MWWYYNKSLGICYWCVKIPQYGYMERELKPITLYVQKRISALTMCYNPGLVRDKPLGVSASVKLVYCNHSRWNIKFVEELLRQVGTCITFRPPARWAHGLLWWPRTAITNVVSCLVKRLPLFLYCLSEIKFTTTTSLIFHRRGLDVGITPPRAKFFRGNIKIYLHCMSLPHIDMTQVVGIFLRVKQGLAHLI